MCRTSQRHAEQTQQQVSPLTHSPVENASIPLHPPDHHHNSLPRKRAHARWPTKRHLFGCKRARVVYLCVRICARHSVYELYSMRLFIALHGKSCDAHLGFADRVVERWPSQHSSLSARGHPLKIVVRRRMHKPVVAIRPSVREEFPSVVQSVYIVFELWCVS